MDKACYRSIHRYKYQLVKPYPHNVEIEGHDIDTPYLGLNNEGILLMKKGYAWDGPSGPTIDTLNFMRGSLVHDALYQLIRMEKISYDLKDRADRILQEICRKDGMSSFRAWYVYHAVKMFGGSSAKPGRERPDKVVCVPAEKD